MGDTQQYIAWKKGEREKTESGEGVMGVCVCVCIGGAVMYRSGHLVYTQIKEGNHD